MLDLKNAQKLLVQSQKSNDLIGESLATAQISYDFRALGHIEKSLKYGLKSVEIANKTRNEIIKTYIFVLLGNDYKDLKNYPKAIDLYSSAVAIGEKLKYYKSQTWAYENLSKCI